MHSFAARGGLSRNICEPLLGGRCFPTAGLVLCKHWTVYLQNWLTVRSDQVWFEVHLWAPAVLYLPIHGVDL